MRSATFSPEAKADLDDIYETVKESGAVFARRIAIQLRDASRRLAEMPGMGHRREEITDPMLRIWPVHSWLIIYRPIEDGVEIVRIIHGARDVGDTLK